MRIFWASGWIAILSRIIISIPYFVYIILCIDYGFFKVDYLIPCIFSSYILYFIGFGWRIGVLFLNRKFLFVPSDFLPRFNRLQYVVKINFQDIFSIEFKVMDGDSNGDKLYRAWNMLYLEIITNTNNIYRISMDKFSKKQCKKIEDFLILNIPNLYVVKSINEYIK